MLFPRHDLSAVVYDGKRNRRYSKSKLFSENPQRILRHSVSSASQLEKEEKKWRKSNGKDQLAAGFLTWDS